MQKWSNLQGLEPEHRAVVRAALRFREGPLALYHGLRAGNERLRRGQWGQAARFYAGAIRRYATWFATARHLGMANR